MRDSYHGNLTMPAFDYASLSHDATGHIIDTLTYNSCLFLLHVHAVQNADANHYFVISLCAGSQADMSDEVQVTAATGLLGNNLVLDSTSYANHTATLGYVGGKRYVRLKITEVVTSGTTQAHMSAVVALDHGSLQPLNTAGLV
jgi:hypothetical protein